MLILARFKNFCDFHDIQKAAATEFLRTLNFEINYFLFICLKIFVFQGHKFVPREVERKFEIGSFFSFA